MNGFLLQAMMDAVGKAAQRERQRTGMTLGTFIEALEKLKPQARVSLDFCDLRPTKFQSYRGYYSDLALGFDADSGGMSAKDLLVAARNCLGRTFEGYKGGDYTMDSGTPLWVANYGDTGWRIVGLRVTNYKHNGSQYANIEARPDSDE